MGGATGPGEPPALGPPPALGGGAIGPGGATGPSGCFPWRSIPIGKRPRPAGRPYSPAGAIGPGSHRPWGFGSGLGGPPVLGSHRPFGLFPVAVHSCRGATAPGGAPVFSGGCHRPGGSCFPWRSIPIRERPRPAGATGPGGATGPSGCFPWRSISVGKRPRPAGRPYSPAGAIGPGGRHRLGGGKRREMNVHGSRIPGFFSRRFLLTPLLPLSNLRLAAGIARDPDGRRKGRLPWNPAHFPPCFRCAAFTFTRERP